MTTSILNDWLNESEENKKLYAEESLILEVSEMIWDELKKENSVKRISLLQLELQSPI